MGYISCLLFYFGFLFSQVFVFFDDFDVWLLNKSWSAMINTSKTEKETTKYFL